MTAIALLLSACGVPEPGEWQPMAPTGQSSVTWGPTAEPNASGLPPPAGVTNPSPSPSTSQTGNPPPNTAPNSVPPAPVSSSGPELTARTWRLTHHQYSATLRELLGVEVDLSNFAPETGNGNFVNFSSTAFVRQDLAANYLNTAKLVVSALTREQLAALTSCQLTINCSGNFINELARRVFRRPAPEDVVSQYQGIIDLAASSNDAAAVEAGFRSVVVAMLNSPFFLYRTEIGAEEAEGQTRFELTEHELANELSFSLLGKAPPEWLSQLADTGQLRDRDVLGTAVRQLLTDPASNTELGRFLTEWLEVDDFEQTTKSDVFPGFDAAKPQMWEELDAFLAVNGQQDNTLVDLLIGPIPEVSRSLTDFYFSDVSAPVDRNNTSRAGVLGLGIVLADHAKSYLTSPTLRGTFVRKRFFCQEITLPPDFTPPPLSRTEALKSARTTRELYEHHQADPTCAPCHDLTDNIGYVMEEFDGAGRVRTLDTTQGFSEPLNLTAPLTASDVNRTISSLQELNTALAESASVRQCLARQAFRFYFGQGEHSAELPPIQRGSAAVAGSTLGALLEGLFTTESTFMRVRETAL